MNLSGESTGISTLDGKIRELRATEQKYYDGNGFVTSKILRMVFCENTYEECKKKICGIPCSVRSAAGEKIYLRNPTKIYFINLVKPK